MRKWAANCKASASGQEKCMCERRFEHGAGGGGVGTGTGARGEPWCLRLGHGGARPRAGCR